MVGAVGEGFPSNSCRQPSSQNIHRTWLHFAKTKSHPQVHHRISNRRVSFERLVFIENLYPHGSAARKRIDGIHVASGRADVTDARGKLRTIAYFMNLSGGNEGKSRRTPTLLFHGLGPSLGRWYSISSSGLTKGLCEGLLLACHSRIKSVTETNFPKYYRKSLPSERVSECPPKVCAEAAESPKRLLSF